MDASGADTARDLNLIGAFGIALADELHDAAAKVSGLAGASSAALVALGQSEDGRTIQSLADALRVSHSRAVRIGDNLEAAGFAYRAQAPDDRRAVQLRLTATGRVRSAAILEARSQALQDAVEGLSDEEAGQLARLAATVLDAMTTGRVRAQSICRLCDIVGCGHLEGRCPVTAAADVRESHAG